MIETKYLGISITRQCELLSVSSSSYYYGERGESPFNQTLMRVIDEQFLDTAYYGGRLMAKDLKYTSYRINRKRIRRLMLSIGIEAIYQKPDTSKPHPEHGVYPYPLVGVDNIRPNLLWCANISYIPIRRGFLYLVAVMDWYSRKVLAWRLRNTLEWEFCISAVEEALGKYGNPEMFNTDQGSQITSRDFTRTLNEASARISMDGKGRWKDNIMIERLWRTLKYECVYLNVFETGSEARGHRKVGGALQQEASTFKSGPQDPV